MEHRTLCLGVATTTLLMGWQTSDAPERFIPGKDYKIPHTQFRTNPHPKWATVKWVPSEDAPFIPIRNECDDAIGAGDKFDATGNWPAKVSKAYAEWEADCQNPVKLFRASAYIATARYLDPKFESNAKYYYWVGYVDRGWDILQKPPQSYEFVRRGYLYCVGDRGFHAFGTLPFRLLDKEPKDRSVVVAMVYDYAIRKPNAEFERRLFGALETVSKTKQWRPWDDYHWAYALRMYGRKHQEAEPYGRAIAKANSAISKTPKGWNPKWIRDWIKETEEERQLPRFGRSPGFKNLDDIDPP